MIHLRPVLGRNRRAGVSPVELAEAFALAKNYIGTGDWLDETGHGHNAVFGAGASTAPLFLTLKTGSKPHLYLPGIAGNYASAPDAAALDITGDIDLRCAASLEDWTPSGTSPILIGKSLTTGNQRSYSLRVLVTTGVLRYVWSTGGGSGTQTVVDSTVAPTVSDGNLLLCRVTHDVDNGAAGNTVTFYTKTSTWANAFADLRSHTGWTQLGSAVVTAGTTSIFNSSALLEMGTTDTGANNPLAGSLAAGAIYNGIAGTEAFAVDYTTAANYNSARTTVTAATGQTVTINRAATGRKSSVVDRPLFLLGTDDYFEVADHAGLNFSETESLTVAVAVRLYGTTANTVILAKKVDLGTGAGYALDRGTGGLAPEFTIADGAAESVDVAPAITEGVATVVAGRRSVTLDQVEGFSAGMGSGSPTTDATTATLANAEALRIGRLSGGGSAQIGGEILGWSIFREALSAADMIALNTAMLV